MHGLLAFFDDKSEYLLLLEKEIIYLFLTKYNADLIIPEVCDSDEHTVGEHDC